MKIAARIDPSLADYPISIPAAPGILIRADLTQNVYVSLFREGCIPHQRGLDKIFRKLIRAGDIVFDVGANIGYTTAVFSSIVGASGTVVAIEPSPTAFPLLARTMSQVRNVTLVNKGMSSETATLKFYVPSSLDLASFTPIEGAEVVSVEAVTGDEIAAEFGHPKVVKVDTEGHELKVFTGLAETIRREDRPVLIFEALIDEEYRASIDVLGRLAGGGYEFYRVQPGGSLSDPRVAGTNDLVALPGWARERASAPPDPTP